MENLRIPCALARNENEPDKGTLAACWLEFRGARMRLRRAEWFSDRAEQRAEAVISNNGVAPTESDVVTNAALICFLVFSHSSVVGIRKPFSERQENRVLAFDSKTASARRNPNPACARVCWSSRFSVRFDGVRPRTLKSELQQKLRTARVSPPDSETAAGPQLTKPFRRTN